MAVLLPQTSGNIVPEYAATSINFNRQIQNISGVLVPVYTAQLSYERKDYLVNATGEKIGVVSLDSPMMPGPDEKRGNILLSPDETMLLFFKVPKAGKALGEVITEEVDLLIHANLVARGIIIV